MKKKPMRNYFFKIHISEYRNIKENKQKKINNQNNKPKNNK